MKDWKKIYRKAFNAHVKKLIEASGKGIPTVAADGNAENKTIYRILADENEPQITTVLHLAKGLGIHPMELYNFEFPLELLDPLNNGSYKAEQTDKTSE